MLGDLFAAYSMGISSATCFCSPQHSGQISRAGDTPPWALCGTAVAPDVVSRRLWVQRPPSGLSHPAESPCLAEILGCAQQGPVP